MRRTLTSLLGMLLIAFSYAQTNMPLIEVIGPRKQCVGSFIELAANEGIGWLWSTGETTQSILVYNSGDYSVTIFNSDGSELNSETIELVFYDAPPEPLLITQQFNIIDEPIYGTLWASGENIKWYNDQFAVEPIGTGLMYSSGLIDSDTTFWVEANSVNGGEAIIGGKIGWGSTGGTSISNGHLIFDVWNPFHLESVKINAPCWFPPCFESEELSITVLLIDALGNVLQTKDFSLNSGENILLLQWDILPAQGMSLQCSQNWDYLFRDNSDVSYPYLIGEYGAITNSNFGLNYYYYFYNWVIREPITTCPSPRLPIYITTAWDLCTNPVACNFSPYASQDDGSCILPDGCNDPLACNFNPLSLCNDGSCLYLDFCGNCDGEEIGGCTDPLACNYNSLAACDDGTCNYLTPQSIIGNPNITPFNTYSYVIPQGDYSIVWSAQNGTIITGQNTNAVQIMWLENGPYTVSATISDALGCVQTSTFIATNNSCNINVSVSTSENSICPGESALLSAVTATPNVSYQWLLNGQEINNATANNYTATTQGDYQVIISIPGCSALSNTIQIDAVAVASEPVIDFLLSNPGCGDGVAILSFNSEDFNSFQWSTGQTSPTISVTTSGAYSVSAVDASGCVVTSEVVPINFAQSEPNPICLVTVDETTGYNTIIWEPITSELVSDYIIYKETNVANQYESIGSVSYGSDGIFTDENSNSAVQASRYKIGVMDICNVESTLSSLHKTIHLTSNLGVGNTVNLIWSHYEGFEFGSYNIYRGTAADNMTLLTTIASNLNSYTDLLPLTNGYYMIEVEGMSCDPSRSIQTSKSNVINYEFVGVNEVVLNNIKLYPNPASDYITLEIPSELIGETMVIYDVTGREIYRSKTANPTNNINVVSFSSGSYVLHVGNANNKFVIY